MSSLWPPVQTLVSVAMSGKGQGHLHGRQIVESVPGARGISHYMSLQNVQACCQNSMQAADTPFTPPLASDGWSTHLAQATRRGAFSIVDDKLKVPSS